MRQILIVPCLIWLFCIGAMGQALSRNNLARAGGPSDKRPADTRVEVPPPDYVIGPEDVLSIVVWHEPDFTNRATVRPDGKIGLPLLNDIQASGLTPNQLQEKLTEGLKKFLADPLVSVIVQEIHSQVVYITGAIGRSGAYPLGRPMTIMELLILAGGFTEFAKSEDVQILRKEGNQLRRFHFNYKQFAEGKNQQDFLLHNGDMVIVP
jgi:polysaccharide biosynthesis/export protein